MTVTAKRAQVPKLRFPEFRDAGAWEERLIEDFFLVGSSKRVLQKDWTTQGIPFYRTRELVSLSKNEPFSNEIFISEELFFEIAQKYGLPTEGDFLVSGVGTLGISYQVRAGDRFYFKDGNVLWLKLKSGIVSTFFKYCFQSDGIQNQVLGQASISTVGTYTIQNAKATKFCYPPDIEEQQKVADCLSSIDEQITLETQKLDTLKTHKKGLMQELFPAEGETLPKLRFPEFRDAGAWERKQLREITSEFLDGDWIESKDQSSNGIRLLQTGNIGVGVFIPKIENSRYISEETFHRLHCEEVFSGDCLISRLPDPAGRSCLVPDVGQRMITAVDCTIVRFDKRQIIPYIFVLYSQSEQYFQEVSSLCSGSTRQRISRENLSQLKIALPEIHEQQKIADCLSSIDDLITAQAQKLDTLKTHKKGLMQQLFPALDEGQG